MEEKSGYMWSDISSWDQAWRGNCAGITCAAREKCFQIGSTHQCSVSECGTRPALPANTIVYPMKESGVGEMIQVSCAQGYFPQTAFLTCGTDGNWNWIDFTCQDCNDPPIVDNGDVSEGSNLIGSRRRYVCDSGYTLEGDNEIRCQRNLAWTDPPSCGM
ncbi:hypothetical protein ScPMuIL_001586 [Solemya velum]